jgi:hypothetical protein
MTRNTPSHLYVFAGYRVPSQQTLPRLVELHLRLAIRPRKRRGRAISDGAF